MGLNYPTPILSEDFCQALKDAGVLAEGFYKRITIIAEPDSILRIEVEVEADDRLITLIPTLANT